MRKWSSILDSVWSRLEIEFWFRFSGGDIAASVGIIICTICMCAYVFSLLMYLYLCRCLKLRMMREGDFCLVGGDTAATIWGQYFSEIRGPVRFTKYFTIRYNIFPYFTIWGKYFWEITGTAPFALYTLCQKTTSFLPRIIFAQYSSHDTQNTQSQHINYFDLKTQY